MKTSEFVLPENWHVVADEKNINVLRKWRFGGNNEYLTVGCFVGMVNGKKEWDDPECDHFESEYFPNEITFNQFKEHVLKEIITLKSGVKLSEEDIAEVKEILNNK